MNTEKRRVYFADLALSNRSVLRLHKDARLLGKKGSEDDWRNVSRQCLVVAARAQVLGELIGLEECVKAEMVRGALTHDFNKRQEIELRKSFSDQLGFVDLVSKLSKRKEGLKVMNEDEMWLASGGGHEALGEVDEISSKENCSDLELARLAVFYIDCYSVGDWCVSRIEDGKMVGQNAFDVRIGNNLVRYKDLYESEYELGETYYDAYVRIGRNVEEVLLGRLSQQNLNIDREQLPGFIDEQLQAQYAV